MPNSFFYELLLDDGGRSDDEEDDPLPVAPLPWDCIKSWSLFLESEDAAAELDPVVVEVVVVGCPSGNGSLPSSCSSRFSVFNTVVL